MSGVAQLRQRKKGAQDEKRSCEGSTMKRANAYELPSAFSNHLRFSFSLDPFSAAFFFFSLRVADATTMIRRLRGPDLGETSTRRVGFDFKTEYAKSGRSKCRKCGKFIAQGLVRVALMLQDMEGYKSAHWTHFQCFWKHRETKRALRALSNIVGIAQLAPEDQLPFSKAYCELRGLPFDSSVLGNNGNDEGGESTSSAGVGQNAVNAEIAAFLKKKAAKVKREKPHSRFAGKAWLKAASFVAAHPVQLRSEADAAAIHGIGKTIATEIGKFLAKIQRQQAKEAAAAAVATDAAATHAGVVATTADTSTKHSAVETSSTQEPGSTPPPDATAQPAKRKKSPTSSGARAKSQRRK